MQDSIFKTVLGGEGQPIDADAKNKWAKDVYMLTFYIKHAHCLSTEKEMMSKYEISVSSTTF